jgi:hypothetical protein
MPAKVLHIYPHPERTPKNDFDVLLGDRINFEKGYKPKSNSKLDMAIAIS